MQGSNPAYFVSSTNPNPNIAYNGQQFHVSTVPVYIVPHGAQQPTAIPQFSQAPLFHQIFLKGKPRPLGIVLIVTGVLQVALGIAGLFITMALSVTTGIPIWGPVLYIIAGSFTIAARASPNICMVKGSLGLNVVTAICSFVSFILTCVDLVVITNHPYYEDYIGISQGGEAFILAILLISNLLLFSVSISVSVFGCRALGHSPSNAPQMFVIQNGAVGSAPPPPSYKLEDDNRIP